MKIQSVYDKSFKKYGQVLEGYDFTELLETLRAVSEKPMDAVIYTPGCAELETLAVSAQMSQNGFGGMPIQVGYCNGNNTKLGCLEYHRDSEFNVAADDIVLLLGLREGIGDDWVFDTAGVEAFLCPAGVGVELYASAMHYAPCSADISGGFRVVIVLPKGTNTERPDIVPRCHEDKLLTARNKWLLPHPDSSEAKSGAVVGLRGENIDIAPLLPIKT